ncbi:MAG: hypothetical protein RL385_2538 [Pseudomonadota bacterium]|jgi:uncharacterized Zn-binding protein involved in type VI secretion
MIPRTLASTAFLLTLGLAAGSKADSKHVFATPLPTVTEPGVPAGTDAEVLAAMKSELTARGFTLAPPPAQEDLSCFTDECDTRFARLAGAKFAVRAKVFQSRTASLAMFATTAGGAVYATELPLRGTSGAELHAAVSSALTDLERQIKAGQGPFLSVRGTPEGAAVRLDGAPAGNLPMVGARITPGEHTVVVEAPGYASWDHTFTAERYAGSLVELNDVTLSVRTEAQATEAERNTPARPSHAAAWSISGGAVLSVGIALCAVGGVAVARHGDKRAGAADWVRSTNDTKLSKAAGGGLLGVGGLLGLLGATGIGRGVYLAWHAPHIEVSTTGISAQFSGRF